MLLLQNPIRAILAIILVGMLLVFPSGLSILYKNIQNRANSLEQTPKIILFLKGGSSESEIQAFREKLAQRSDIQETVYFSPLTGVKELANQLGLGELLNNISVTLPGVVQVVPKRSITSVDEVQNLADSLKDLPEVASVQMNLLLMKHHYAFLNFWKKIVVVTWIFFSVCVLLAMFFIMQVFLAIFTESKFDPKNIIIDGVIIGVSGSIISLILLYVIFSYSTSSLQELLGYPVVITFGMILKQLLFGLVFGLCGAALAVFIGVPSPKQAIRQSGSNS